jgi:hypothetical protein
MSRHLDLEVTTNADFRAPFELVDPDGAAVNLAGAAIRLDMVGQDEIVQVSAAVDDGIEVTDPANGHFEIAIPEEDMGSVPPGLYNFDLLVGLSDTVARVAHGTVLVREGHTIWTE